MIGLSELTTKKPSKPAQGAGYNTRLQKGGALIEDMRLLVRSWRAAESKEQVATAILENILAKHTRARAVDTFNRTFLPRFIQGSPKAAWRIVRELEDRNLEIEVLRPIYYWITARNERLLAEYVSDELYSIAGRNSQNIIVTDVARWLSARIKGAGKTWTETVTLKVARGLLATLRDFGILEGFSKKRIAPMYLPVESFAYLAFALHMEGVSGEKLVTHPDWRFFLFTPAVVERMFLEADRHRLLSYHSAGKIVRIEFLAQNFGEMADVITARPR